MKAYEDRIEELLEKGQKNADRIVALETQYQSMMVRPTPRRVMAVKVTRHYQCCRRRRSVSMVLDGGRWAGCTLRRPGSVSARSRFSRL